MPVLKRDDASIHYEVHGSGFPVLLFAPGGMRSRGEMWHAPPGGPPRAWNDWTQVLADRFQVIEMDQRNAGRSVGDIRADHGWHTYAGDHLALMDHLGHERFHTLGGCIGGSYCLQLNEMVPERIAAAVLQNPIGLNPDAPTYYQDSFAEWSKEQRAARPELDAAAVQAFGRNMWDGAFVFSVSRDFVRRCTVPCFLLPGSDVPHPAVTSAELAELLPNVEVLHDWRRPEHLDVQRQRVTDFLVKHTP